MKRIGKPGWSLVLLECTVFSCFLAFFYGADSVSAGGLSEGAAQGTLFAVPPEPERHSPDARFPRLDPVNPAGDELYSLYRKGLITRHITRNGRVLPKVALERVDPRAYDRSGPFKIPHSDGTVISLPSGNVRYSEEKTAGNGKTEKILWAPVIAPVKNPGLSNDGYYVVSGNDENPLYYGAGLALATFSLEHLHHVSPHSIQYARRIVRFFLASELTEGSGYLLRETGFFNSRRNIDGGPVIQGASLEELLGFFLGVMYYLKAEDPDEPLYAQAVRLRDDVLRRVSSGPLWSKYEHPFMNSSHYPSYWVKHFTFPYYAVREYRPGFTEYLYRTVLGAGSGRTRSFLCRDKFEDYMLFFTSMLLVLDGAIPDREKERLAGFFMRDVIKASLTAGPDIDSLKDNQYLAAVALLANRYLNDQRDSSRESGILKAIWGGSYDVYLRLVGVALPGPAPDRKGWQHNLPLEAVAGGIAGWKDHNPDRGIGSFFIWRYENERFFWRSSRDGWRGDFPGYRSYPWSGLSISDPADDDAFKKSESKAYPIEGYLQKELQQAHKSDDNQVEGAGLDLLFIRMLLTHINPARYPAPRLPDRNTLYPVLPYEGAEPMSPQLMHYAYQDRSRIALYGRGENMLRVVKTGEGASTDFIVAYASRDKELVLRHGLLPGGPDAGNLPAFRLDAKGSPGKRFEEVALASTTTGKGDNILIAAERAEGDLSLNPFGGCFLRRSHWLRLSLWKVAGREPVPDPSLLGAWESGDPHCDAAQGIAVTFLDRNVAAVRSRTPQGGDHVSLFSVEHGHIRPEGGFRIGDFASERTNTIASAYGDILIYPRQDAAGLRVATAAWSGRVLHETSASPVLSGELLALTTVARKGSQHVLTVTRHNDHLIIYSHEVLRNGTLRYRGELNTNNAVQYLLDGEAGYERASIASFPAGGKPGFVIAGKGAAREVRGEDGRWRLSAKGLKIVYGYLLDDGRPTIETSAVLGSGNPDEIQMLDVTGMMSDGVHHGVVSAHQERDNGCRAGYVCDDRLQLTFWLYRDPYQDQRWHQERQ